MATSGQGKTRGQVGYGDGRAAIRAGDDVLLDEEAMVAELLGLLEAPDYRPPTLPVVAVELMTLSGRVDVAIEDVVALLERDSLIAGRVLDVASSAALSGGNRIGSLREATMRLGLLRIRDLVMQIAMNLRVFKCEAYDAAMERIRRHAVATAHLSRTVCRYTPIEGEFAFMAGLLHDVGIAGTLLALAERKQPRGRKPPDLVSIWPAVDRVHVRAGEIMARHWQLPADIRLAIGGHHQVLCGGHPHPLAATVALANEIAHAEGAGLVEKAGDEVADGGSGAETRDAADAASAADWTSAFSELDRTGPKTLASARAALGLDDRVHGLIVAEARTLLGTLDGEP